MNEGEKNEQNLKKIGELSLEIFIFSDFSP